MHRKRRPELAWPFRWRGNSKQIADVARDEGEAEDEVVAPPTLTSTNDENAPGERLELST
jgi:hypothetical protein